MSQKSKTQPPASPATSVIDRARSRNPKAGDASSSKPAKSARTKKAAANVGLRKSDLPERYANEGEINKRQAAFEESGAVTVTRDAWEGTIEHRRDDPERAPDPNAEAVDAIRRPGRAYRVLSPRVMNRRGRRGWEIERDKDGKPIEVPGNGQLIGSMPIEQAVARNKKFQQASMDQVAQAHQAYDDAAEQLEHESQGAVSVLKRGEMVKDNDPRNKGRGGAAVIGAETFRG